MSGTPSVYQQIPVDKIVPSPSQARKVFNEASLLELANTIKETGLLQAIVVRVVSSPLPPGERASEVATGQATSPDVWRARGEGKDLPSSQPSPQKGEGGTTSYELIAGERRWRAVKLLGWTTIEAKVEKVDDPGQAAVKGLIENLQREDLNPLERAQGYKLLADKGVSREEIAKKVGLNDSNTVDRHLAILGMPSEIQELLPRGSLSEGHTRFLRQLPDKAQQIKLAQQADKEGWSVKETEKRVNALMGKKPKQKSSGVPAAGQLGIHITEAGPTLKITGFVFKAMSKQLVMSVFEEAYDDWQEEASQEPEPIEPLDEAAPSATTSLADAQPPAVLEPVPQKKVLDPKIAAMIERQRAKGKIL